MFLSNICVQTAVLLFYYEYKNNFSGVLPNICVYFFKLNIRLETRGNYAKTMKQLPIFATLQNLYIFQQFYTNWFWVGILIDKTNS